MNTVQRIAKNALVLSLSSLVSVILGFFFMMYVARYLSAGGFGILTFALAFAGIFNVFTDIGLSTLTIREVARDKSLATKYLGNIAVLKIVLSVVVFGLVALTINLLGYPQETTQVVYLIALSLILDAFSLMFNAIFQAHERMEFVTIGSVLASALRLSGALLVTGQGWGIVALGYVFVVASTILLGYSAVTASWRFARFRVELDLGFVKNRLRQALPFGLATIFSSIFYCAPSIMLSLMQGNEAVGWYNAAFKVVTVLLFFPGAYFNAVFPVMSRFHTSSKESVRFAYEKSVKYMAILAVPVGAGFTLLAERVISLVFGPGYIQSVLPLQILVWSLVFISVSGLYAQLFNALDKQATVAKVGGISAFINVLLNSILIPRYGYVGASITAVVGEFVALSLFFFLSSGVAYGIPARKVVGMVSRILAASAVMSVFVFYFRGVALWWLVPLAALLYFAILYISRAVDREDLFLLRQVVRRQGNPSAAAHSK